MRIERDGNLRILYPEKGMLIFKKSDEERTYHDMIYMAKSDTEDDYGEVTYDYVYGHQYDDTIKDLMNKHEQQETIIDLQADVIDYFILNNNDRPHAIMPLTLMAMPSSFKAIEEINPDPLVKYLAMRIKMKKLDYDLVMSKYPEYQDVIDELLK